MLSFAHIPIQHMKFSMMIAQLELTSYAIPVAISIMLITILQKWWSHHFPIAPGGLPFIGHTLSLANTDRFLVVINKWAIDVGNEGVFEFSLFGQRWVVLCSADVLMQ